MLVNGWSDSGQSYSNSRDGILLEGRHGTLDALAEGQCVHGAHCADESLGISFNSDIGIENEGTYTTAHMPKEQWDALVELCARICIACHLDAAGIAADGKPVIMGHRDSGIPDQCPGDWFHSQLPELRKQVHEKKLALMAPPQK